MPFLPAALTEMNFTLTDHRGRATGPEDWIGRPTMVFFGFTYCPDVCPTILADISGWLDALDDDAERLNIAFVSVDPERDTQEAMASYVAAFDPRIAGYTGSPEEIARVARGFRVTYERITLESGGYTMNHTASVILYNDDGSFAGTIDYHEPREFALPKLRRVLASGDSQ